MNFSFSSWIPSMQSLLAPPRSAAISKTHTNMPWNLPRNPLTTHQNALYEPMAADVHEPRLTYEKPNHRMPSMHLLKKALYTETLPRVAPALLKQIHAPLLIYYDGSM
jgi:hypothetical protein